MNSNTRARRKTDRVISFGSPKEAALYFDQVLPIDFALPLFSAFAQEQELEGAEQFREFTSLEVPVERDALNSVLQSLSRGDEKLIKGYSDLIPLNVSPWAGMATLFDSTFLDQEYMDNARQMIERAGLDFDEFVEWLRKRGGFSTDAFFERYRDHYNKVLTAAGLGNAPTWSGRLAPNFVKDEGQSREQNFAIVLRNLEMIDVTKLEWEKIIEFRRDPDHMSSLRDLRLYFDENFEGADPSLVRDRLDQAIEHQRATAHFWGFETVKKTFAVASTKGNVALTGMASLASAMAGAPLAIAAAAGAVITTASCALEFTQIYVDERKARLSRPLRFLTKAQALHEE